jgi:hypothetical protein
MDRLPIGIGLLEFVIQWFSIEYRVAKFCKVYFGNKNEIKQCPTKINRQALLSRLKSIDLFDASCLRINSFRLFLGKPDMEQQPQKPPSASKSPTCRGFSF